MILAVLSALLGGVGTAAAQDAGIDFVHRCGSPASLTLANEAAEDAAVFAVTTELSDGVLDPETGQVASWGEPRVDTQNVEVPPGESRQMTFVLEEDQRLVVTVAGDGLAEPARFVAEEDCTVLLPAEELTRPAPTTPSEGGADPEPVEDPAPATDDQTDGQPGGQPGDDPDVEVRGVTLEKSEDELPRTGTGHGALLLLGLSAIAAGGGLLRSTRPASESTPSR